MPTVNLLLAVARGDTAADVCAVRTLLGRACTVPFSVHAARPRLCAAVDDVRQGENNTA